MLKAFKYRIYPTKEQKVLIEKHFGCCRFVYNWGLETKIKHYAETSKGLSFFQLSKKLTEMKKENLWLNEVICDTLHTSLLNLETAFTNFYRKQNAFPRFKCKYKSKPSYTYFQNIYLPTPQGQLRLPKVGLVQATIHRTPIGRVKSLTISKTPTNKYYASLSVETNSASLSNPLILPETLLGIDLGVKTFATLSDGRKFENPKHLETSLQALKVHQRRLSKKKPGSKNREQQKRKVALIHEHVSNQRKDFLHKLTYRLCHENQVQSFGLETLGIQEMLQKAPTALSRSISDVGWYTFKVFLEYKCRWYGKSFIQIGQFEPSSKICSACGAVNRTLRLEDRTWKCSCGVVHDRDVNAALNIKTMAFQTYLRTGGTRSEVKNKALLRNEGCKSSTGEGEKVLAPVKA